MPPTEEKHNLGLTPKILDRYIAREFLFSYIVTLAVVLSLRILLDMFSNFDEFIETEKSGVAPTVWNVAIRIPCYYAPKLFEYFRDFSGTTILLAAAFSLARMTRQNELTAVLASGISLKRVIGPIVLLGFALNMVMVLDQEIILPSMSHVLVRRHDEMSTLRRVKIWNLPDKNEALLNGDYDPQTQTILDMLVILRQDALLSGTIKADSATWQADQKRWVLTNGQYFKPVYTADVADSNYQPVTQITYYQSELSPQYLWLQRNSAFKNLMSSRELTQLLLSRALRPVDRAEALSEKHFRFTDPIINMVMLMLGLPMLVSRERRSTKTSIALAMLGAGGCFVATFACKLLASGNIYVGSDFKRLLLAWLPIIVFLPMSVLALDEIKT
jgi:lipopolysaccharide export system permease protein